MFILLEKKPDSGSELFIRLSQKIYCSSIRHFEDIFWCTRSWWKILDLRQQFFIKYRFNKNWDSKYMYVKFNNTRKQFYIAFCRYCVIHVWSDERILTLVWDFCMILEPGRRILWVIGFLQCVSVNQKDKWLCHQYSYLGTMYEGIHILTDPRM